MDSNKTYANEETLSIAEESSENYNEQRDITTLEAWKKAREIKSENNKEMISPLYPYTYIPYTF